MPSPHDSALTAAPGFRDGFTRADGLPVVPVVLGVVGRRKIRDGDRDVLRASVVAILRQFRTAYPRTPVVLLTALAQGADQIAAEAALDVDGVFVRAPLPFPLEAYRASTSFDADERGREAVAAFDRLYADTRVESFVVPLPEGLARDLEALGPSRVAAETGDATVEALRNTCYANAGGYITRHCHALIALWDGRSADLDHPSGSTEYVDMKLFGEAPSHYPWADEYPLGFLGERGLVVVVHTPQDRSEEGPSRQAGAPAIVGEVGVLVPNDRHEERWLAAKHLPLATYDSAAKRFFRRVFQSFGLGASPPPHDRQKRHARFELRQFREICSTIEDYNRDVGRPDVAPVIADGVAKAGQSLEAHDFDETHNRWLARIGRTKEAAGAVANRLDRVQHGVQIAIFVLLACSVASFHLYAHHTHGHEAHYPSYLLVFAFALVLTFVLVTWSWWNRIDQRRIDSRTLTEALRVRHAWGRAGVARSVADGYLRQHRSELSWIRQALLHVSPPPSVWSEQFDRLDEPRQRRALVAVKETWGEEQRSYFARRRRHCHRRATRCRVAGFLLALAGWATLCYTLFQPWHPAPAADESAAESRKSTGPEHPKEWLLIGTSLAIIGGGLLIAYSERRSYEELAHQYERMEVVFEHGLTALSRFLGENSTPADLTRARAVIEELGRESMMEHAQWLLLRRSRPLELQIGG